jgi:chromosome segregation ATPase
MSFVDERYWHEPVKKNVGHRQKSYDDGPAFNPKNMSSRQHYEPIGKKKPPPFMKEKKEKNMGSRAYEPRYPVGAKNIGYPEGKDGEKKKKYSPREIQEMHERNLSRAEIDDRRLKNNTYFGYGDNETDSRDHGEFDMKHMDNDFGNLTDNTEDESDDEGNDIPLNAKVNHLRDKLRELEQITNAKIANKMGGDDGVPTDDKLNHLRDKLHEHASHIGFKDEQLNFVRDKLHEHESHLGFKDKQINFLRDRLRTLEDSHAKIGSKSGDVANLRDRVTAIEHKLEFQDVLGERLDHIKGHVKNLQNKVNPMLEHHEVLGERLDLVRDKLKNVTAHVEPFGERLDFVKDHLKMVSAKVLQPNESHDAPSYIGNKKHSSVSSMDGDNIAISSKPSDGSELRPLEAKVDYMATRLKQIESKNSAADIHAQQIEFLREKVHSLEQQLSNK